MADVVLLAKQAPGPEKAEKACPWYAGGCHGEGSAPCIYPGNTEVNMSPLIPPPPLQRTVAWHPPLKKNLFPLQSAIQPSPFPKPFELLIPSSTPGSSLLWRSSRNRHQSSIFPAETHPGHLQEMSRTDKRKSKRPDSHCTEHYTHDIHGNSRG